MITLRALYKSSASRTLRCGARSARDRAAAATDAMVGSVQGLLRPSPQHVSLRQSVDGLLGDSVRKSMSAMLERVSEPTSYQAFQHFITHAPWDAEAIWRRLRAVIPERAGILILDATSFPQSGPHSVGVARQYCGPLGKVANCQVAVTVLWTGRRAWPLGALLYLPESWTSDGVRRVAARIPAAIDFQEKWRLALTLVRRSRAAELTPTAVVADAEYGDNSTVRQALHRLRLPYALGISPTLMCFAARRRSASIDGNRLLAIGATAGRIRKPWPCARSAMRCRRARGAASRGAMAPIRRGRRTSPPSASPGHRLAASATRPRDLVAVPARIGPDGTPTALLRALPVTASLSRLVRLVHHRWASEQHYQDLKTELGLGHFEGRSCPGWQHHMVISAVAYAFIQRERMQPHAGDHPSRFRRPGRSYKRSQSSASGGAHHDAVLLIGPFRSNARRGLKELRSRLHELNICDCLDKGRIFSPQRLF